MSRLPDLDEMSRGMTATEWLLDLLESACGPDSTVPSRARLGEGAERRWSLIVTSEAIWVEPRGGPVVRLMNEPGGADCFLARSGAAELGWATFDIRPDGPDEEES